MNSRTSDNLLRI